MKIKPQYLFYFFPFLFWIVAYFGFSFDGLYGQDSYEYLRYSEALTMFFEMGKPPGDYFWGIYYPVLGSLLGLLVSNVSLGLQLLSVASLTIASVHTDKIIRLVYQTKKTINIPFLFFTLSPFILIHSVLVMSDLLACAFVVLAIYRLLHFLEKSKTRDILFGALFCALALFTRYAAAVVLFPFCFVVLLRVIKTRNYKCMAFSIAILAVIAIPHILIRSQNSLQFLSHQWLTEWNFTNIFNSSFVTVDGRMDNHLINLCYAFFSFYHPAFLVFGVFFLIFAMIYRTLNFNLYRKIILVSIVLYALFLAGIPFQNKRFLIVSFPLVVVFIFPLVQKITDKLSYKTLAFAVALLAQLFLTAYYGKSLYDRNVLERNIVSTMKPYQGQTLYAFDIDIAMKGRKADFKYRSLWKTAHPNFEKNALVLVNNKQLEKQWQGKNPMKNWEYLRHHYALEKIKNLNDGFNLYRIGQKK